MYYIISLIVHADDVIGQILVGGMPYYVSHS